MVGFPSGQRGQTVNLLAPPSKVRILLPPLSRSGGTGRRAGLKILFELNRVPVRFRSAALVKSRRNVEFTAFLLFFCFKKFEHL